MFARHARRRDGTHRQDPSRPCPLDLPFQPFLTRRHCRRRRALVPIRPHVLARMAKNGIREVDLRRVDASQSECTLQSDSCRSHERLAPLNFLMPGGLPNDHEVGLGRAIPPERTADLLGDTRGNGRRELLRPRDTSRAIVEHRCWEGGKVRRDLPPLDHLERRSPGPSAAEARGKRVVRWAQYRHSGVRQHER